MMPTPWAFRSRITRKRLSTSWSLSDAVGSSMIRIRASAPRARAISTSCCSGIDSRRTSRAGVDRRADPIEEPLRPLAPLAPADPPPVAARLQPQGDVLGHRQVGEERRLLIDGRDPQRLGPRRVVALDRLPVNLHRPLVGACAPVMILISVDLPAPFSPISAWTSPARRSNETPFRAWTPPKALLIPVSFSNVVTCRSLRLSHSRPGRTVRPRD